MVREIIFFYKMASKMEKKYLDNQTLGEFLKSKKMSSYFVKFHIVPMVAAIWSVPIDLAGKMPLSLFINFFQNHGLFKIKNRPQWYTVSGRSKTYVNKILHTISGEYFKNYKIKNVLRSENSVRLYYGSTEKYFDYEKVVFAVHANEVLDIIDNPTENEKKILKNFKYKKNLAFLHNDPNLMPTKKKAWSSWNAILNKNNFNSSCVTYWLNNLQNLKTENDYFLTLNPIVPIEKDKIIKKVEFFHPIYDMKTIIAQENLSDLQGIKNSWYCGSYFGYGFHEDGLKSAMKIASKL